MVGLSAFTGIVWAIDALFFARRRRAAAAASLASENAVREPLVVEYSRSFFPVIFIVLIVRSFLAEPFRIPSSSMMPTLLIGDFILVNKFAYGLRLPVLDTKILPLGEPERGDVVVFRYPGFPCDGREERSGSRCGPSQQATPVPHENYIKRVVGLPGDLVEYRNKTLFVNGEQIATEPAGTFIGEGQSRDYTGHQMLREQLGEAGHDILLRPQTYYQRIGEGSWTVPEGNYFVMGDNRDHSEDSRFWEFVPERNLVGKAFLVWLSWDSGIVFERMGTVIH
nr:signal peptidase I [Chiayiivirga flava]